MFAADWKKLQQDRDDEVRLRLAKERLILIQDGKPTAKLISALKEVFMLYAGLSPMCDTSDDDFETEKRLNRIMAARLWYRCGMKLSHLEVIFEEKSSISFQDFLDPITRVIEEDCLATKILDTDWDTSKFEVSFLDFEDPVWYLRYRVLNCSVLFAFT